ncbi:ATP-binding protein [Robertmurraya andreesenii]|uniref:DNA replication protein DnaC n=1 Tax=Anoxybacillus andreesenii TaxID=1325932 RepID=A0ABT9V9J2_9BACL|nr:ATP-binding protein [Robertmurraya andreesenii]MDQ0157629.1 DNA replication protein DnaC [Robertmurraya andreesenii]
MSQLKKSEELLKTLHLSEAAHSLSQLVKQAETNESSYLSFLNSILEYEQKRREEKQLEKRLKWAAFPFQKTLDEFHLEEQQSLSQKQLNHLRELTWVEQLYNIILLGPPGIGNYRKNLVMERNERTSCYSGKCTLISFHNTSE